MAKMIMVEEEDPMRVIAFEVARGTTTTLDLVVVEAGTKIVH